MDVTKSQYDPGCTGANTSESVLTPNNVKSSTFGKLFTKSVDGQVYAQPLYLQDFSINGGVHNIVFICTEHNSMYAFDADNRNAEPFWRRSLPAAVQSVFSCSDLVPEVGITATPVIDRAAGAMYVEASTLEEGTYFNKLFAINLSNGSDLMPPVTITASVSGSGSGSLGGTITFDSFLEFSRPGLLLLNGKIYIGFGSHCDDGNYHGWILAYNANDLGQYAVRCITPNGSQGSIWQHGGGLSSDGTSIFCVSGNGSFSFSDGNFGLSALKFDGKLNLVSFFAPYNGSLLDNSDLDLCSNVMLVPGSDVCTMQGKAGAIYIMKQNDLGGFNPVSDSIVQRFDNAFAFDESGGNPIPVFWNNLFYLWAGNDHLRVYRFNGHTLDSVEQASNALRQSDHAGSISLSANGVADGVLWGTNAGTGRIYAFNASNVSTMLWNDGQAPASRDILGGAVQKYARPVVANGKVYVGTVNSLVVYGLLGGSGLGGGTGCTRPPRVPAIRIVKKYVLLLTFKAQGDYSMRIVDTQGKTRAQAAGTTAQGDYVEINLGSALMAPGCYFSVIVFSSGRQVLTPITVE